MHAAHGADAGRVVHHLRVNADQDCVDTDTLVSDCFDETLDVVDGDPFWLFGARLARHTGVAVKVVEHTAAPCRCSTTFGYLLCGYRWRHKQSR